MGLMEIENLFRSTALAVGLKPSAMQGKARLRGLYRIIYSKDHKPSANQGKARRRGLYRIISSKTISPPEAKMERSRNPVKGSTYLRTAIIRYSPRAVGLKPSAIRGKARLRGLDRTYLKIISPRLCRAKPACAGESGGIAQQPY